MIYGLYLSASGVLAGAHRQDVIANNLANAETVGFKRDLALFQEQRTAAADVRLRPTHPVLEFLGGGLRPSPTATDHLQGELEPTGSPMDVAIQGRGYFMVDDGQQRHLTRDGRFLISPAGELVLSTDPSQRVLDHQGQPILLDPRFTAIIGQDGQITQEQMPVGRIALMDVDRPRLLQKRGGSLLAFDAAMQFRPSPALLRSEFVERANVDPASELVRLMESQRLLEANANMIRYQDQTLSRLVNDVGRIT